MKEKPGERKEELTHRQVVSCRLGALQVPPLRLQNFGSKSNKGSDGRNKRNATLVGGTVRGARCRASILHR